MAKWIIKQIFIEYWDAFTKGYGNNIAESVFHDFSSTFALEYIRCKETITIHHYNCI